MERAPQPQSEPPSITVIGAGLAGGLAALALARRGASVQLIAPSTGSTPSADSIDALVATPTAALTPSAASARAWMATALSYGSVAGPAAAAQWQELERRHGSLGWRPSAVALHGCIPQSRPDGPAAGGNLRLAAWLRSWWPLLPVPLPFSRVDAPALALALPAALQQAGVELTEQTVIGLTPSNSHTANNSHTVNSSHTSINGHTAINGLLTSNSCAPHHSPDLGNSPGLGNSLGAGNSPGAGNSLGASNSPGVGNSLAAHNSLAATNSRAASNSLAASDSGWCLRLADGREQHCSRLLLAAGAGCLALWPPLQDRLRVSWAGVLLSRRLDGPSPWLEAVRRGWMVFPRHLQRPELERRGPSSSPRWILDLGLAPWGEGAVLGQITWLPPDPLPVPAAADSAQPETRFGQLDLEPGQSAPCSAFLPAAPPLPPDPAELERWLRQGLGLLDPALASVEASFHLAPVSYSANAIPLCEALAPGLWVLAGCSNAYSHLPALTEALAQQILDPRPTGITTSGRSARRSSLLLRSPWSLR